MNDVMQGESSAAALRRGGRVHSRKIGGLDIAYWHQPGGPNTIVFIHGNSSCKEAFFEQFTRLADAGYSLLAIDLPGQGMSQRSDTPEADYTLPAIALTLKRLLAELGILQPLVFGWSLGGHIAIEMAGRGFPMAGMMIAGTPPVGPGLQDLNIAFKPSDAMSVTMKPDPSEAELETYLRSVYGTLTPYPAAFLAQAKQADGAVRAAIFADLASGEHGCHQETVVRGWQKPICILHGDQDALVSSEYLQRFDTPNFWRGGVVTMKGVGHAPFMERPDEFNALLIDFARHVFRSGDEATPK